VNDQQHTCPHCGRKMSKWQAPVESNWCGEIRFVCFFDECPYYVRGWALMEERYGVTASYRHSINPETGFANPLPVASPDHLKPGIVE
jgi:hypothetical protein